MFNWLRRSDSKPHLRFHVWLSEEAKLKALMRIAMESTSPGQTTVLVAHFAEMYQILGSLLDEHGITYSSLALDKDFQPDSGLGTDHAGVYIALLDDRVDTQEAAEVSSASPTVRVVVVEAHPLECHNRTVQNLADSLPPPSMTEYHVSLDEPVMRIFVDDNTIRALTALGLKDDSCIDHAMVDKSMVRAMQKIEKASTGDRPADSAEHWLSLNCPEVSVN